MVSRKKILLVLMLLFGVVGSVNGQLNGTNIKGDVGLTSGSQPPSGTYLTNISYFYESSEIKLPNRTVNLAGGLNVYLNTTVISWVTNKKFLGANYGVQFAVPALNSKLELPRARTSDQTFGISDLYVMPLFLGWHKKRADYTAAFAFVAPTGRYSPGGDKNTGLGMWAYEISAGTTVYLDKRRSWNVSTLAAYEMHGKKRDSDVKVGDILTLEGGIGKTMSKGLLNLGAVYYAQWKVTADSGADLPALLLRFGVDNAKNRSFAVGAEVSRVVPRLESQFNVRALKEFGNSTATQGYAVVASFTFFVDRPFREMAAAAKAQAEAAEKAKSETATPATQP